MRRKVQTVPEQPATESKCRHHWVVESPDGPTSKGVCKLCGAEKEFLNSSLDLRRKGDVSMLLELPDLPDIEPDREWDDS